VVLVRTDIHVESAKYGTDRRVVLYAGIVSGGDKHSIFRILSNGETGMSRISSAKNFPISLFCLERTVPPVN
jgi:hypothetical protein